MNCPLDCVLCQTLFPELLPNSLKVNILIRQFSTISKVSNTSKNLFLKSSPTENANKLPPLITVFLAKAATLKGIVPPLDAIHVHGLLVLIWPPNRITFFNKTKQLGSDCLVRISTPFAHLYG